MSTPRVLHIITRLDAGGAAANTLASVDLLRQHGFDTALAYGVTSDPDDRVAPHLERMGVRSFFMPHLVREVSPWQDLRTLRQTIRLIRQERCDLVHTHCSKAGVTGRLAARRCGVPAIHTPHGHIFYGYFGRWPTAAFVAIERRLARRTARIVSLTNRETGESLERGIGWRDQYVTVPSGVPLARFRGIPAEAGRQFRGELEIPDDAFLFVSVGRLVPVKGFDILLRAFASATLGDRPAHLAIVGGGEEHARLEALARELKLHGRVRFAGHRPDVTPALSAASAFVMASRNEGMGRAFIEAMASGLPVIGTRVGGVPEFLKDRETGLLVEKEDPVSLAQALRTLAGDAALRTALGARAAAAVFPEYDERTMIERLAALYRDVLRAKKSP